MINFNKENNNQHRSLQLVNDVLVHGNDGRDLMPRL